MSSNEDMQNAVPAPCQGVQQPQVWDAHVHSYPDRMRTDPAGWAGRHREAHWGRLVSSSVQGWAGVEDMIGRMDRDGVAVAVLAGWYWENAESALRHNDWMAECVARYPDRLKMFAAFHPDLSDPSAFIVACAQMGACGIGECLPQLQHPQGWAHPAWAELIAATTRRQWPVLLHVTEPVGHAYPGRVATPLDLLVDMFEAHTHQKWIAAHWGGGLPFYSLNERVRKALANVWVDTAASPRLYSPRIWRAVADVFGAEKILFGSDFPLLNYPRLREPDAPGWRGILQEIRAAGLNELHLESILGDNLKRLLATAE